MNTKRSYIESLNAGRQRREHSSLEELNRSLASLDERFSRGLRDDEADPRGAISQRPAPSFGEGRAGEGGAASMGRIATELNSLREELRRRVEGASRTYEAPVPPRSGGFGGSDLAALHREVAWMRDAVDSLAREETVQSVGRRFEAVEARLSDSGDGAMAGVADRLEQIHEAVSGLPDSAVIGTLDEKMRTLASAVEHLARQKEMPGTETFTAIEERLDEISRAIVASSTPHAPDFEHLARIEARITSLSRQLEELFEDRPVDAVMKQLSALSDRVEDIAGRAEMPDGAVDRLARQIDLISRKLEDGAPAFDPEIIFQGMEKRFDALTRALEQRQETAREQSVALFRDLEERLERYNQDALSTDATIVEALNKRFSDIEETLAGQGGSGPGTMHALENRLDDIIERLGRLGSQPGAMDPDKLERLESQVQGLTAHVAQTGRPISEFDDIGPRLELIERSLMESHEAIVAAAREAAENAVSSQNLTEADATALRGLAEELQSLEVLARQSDERNTRTFDAIHDTLVQIVDRLGTLEDGNASPAPFVGKQAVSRSGAEPAPERMREIAEAPSLDLQEAEPLVETASTTPKGEVMRDPKRSPAEAAAAAAMAALSSSAAVEASPEPTPKKKSRLVRLSRVLSRRKLPEAEVEEKREPVGDAEPTEGSAPEIGLDEPLDPKLANQPLEPGSGAPDLNAIMKRVRDERGDEGRARDAEAAKSDFIAAARRAAQAAAAEAEVLKKKSDPKGSSSGLLKRLLRSNTKMVVLVAGVVVVGVAGAQLGAAMMQGRGHKTLVAKSPATHIAPASSAKKVASAKPEATAKPQAAAMTKSDAGTNAAMSPVEPLAEKAPGIDAGEAMAPKSQPLAPVTSGVAAQQDAKPAEAPDATPSKPAMGVTKVAAGATAADIHPDAAPAVPASSPAGAVEERTASADPAASSSPSSAPLATTAPAAPVTDTPATAPAAEMMPVPDDAGPLPLREAAEGGDPKAMFEIGTRYADGRGTAADLKTAAGWYAQAAGMGFAPAQYRIGNFYEKGIGVGRDIAKAEDWYRKAADRGNAAAMHNLGVLYAMGADGPVDNEAAAKWFEKAAELGVKDSQFNLGILAAKGVGMPQSLEESYKWFALVAKTGDKDAAAKRDEVANSLRPEQLEKARAAVELWKAKPVDVAANIVDIPDAWRESDAKTASIDMKQAVRNIQLILNKNGYDAGAADGVMGGKTKTAIADFQKANGMEPTGEVNEALVTALLKKK